MSLGSVDAFPVRKNPPIEDIDLETYDFTTCPTRRNPTGPYDKLDVAAAILKTNGSYAEMAALLGRNRSAVREHVLADSFLKSLVDDVREVMLDKVEDSVFASAMAGDGPSQRFLLSTIGKNRGYTTRVENTGADGGPIPVAAVSMTLEEAREEARKRGLPDRIFAD